MEGINKKNIRDIIAALSFYKANLEKEERLRAFSYIYKEERPLEDNQLDALIENLIDADEYVYNSKDFFTERDEIKRPLGVVHFLVSYCNEEWFIEGPLYVSYKVPLLLVKELSKKYWIDLIDRRARKGLSLVDVNVHTIEIF